MCVCVEEGNVGWLLWCRAHHQLIVCVCRGTRIKESTTPSRWISSLIKIPILKRLLLLVILPLSQEIIIAKKIPFKRYFTFSLGRINPSIEMQPQTILIKSTVHSFSLFFHIFNFSTNRWITRRWKNLRRFSVPFHLFIHLHASLAANQGRINQISFLKKFFGKGQVVWCLLRRIAARHGTFFFIF